MFGGVAKEMRLVGGKDFSAFGMKMMEFNAFKMSPGDIIICVGGLT